MAEVLIPNATIHPQIPDSLPEIFRFTDLPGELRLDVYREYFGTWDAFIEYDRRSASFKVGGLPVYNLMLASRMTHSESNHFIEGSFSGRLVLRDIKVRRERGFGYVSSVDVMASLCPKWLLDKTEVLTIEHGTSGMLVNLPWFRLQSLKEISLTGSGWPDAHCYPCGLSLTAKAAQESQIVEGRYDTWCLHGYNTWTCVPADVASGQVRVFTIRQGIIKGQRLKARMEHKADRVEVIDRWINYVLQHKDLNSAAQSDQAVPISCRPM